MGAVAQMGERRVRNAKVEGSIPFGSTISMENCSVGTPLEEKWRLGEMETWGVKGNSTH